MHTPTKAFYKMFNTAIQDQWAKMVPTAPENEMDSRINYNNTNPFLEPRLAPQRNLNPFLVPTSTHSDNTTPFLVRPIVRFSPSVTNNSQTKGCMPPTRILMSTLSSIPIRPSVSRAVPHSLNMTYTNPTTLIMSSTLNPNFLNGPSQSALARDIILNHRKKKTPEFYS